MLTAIMYQSHTTIRLSNNRELLGVWYDILDSYLAQSLKVPAGLPAGKVEHQAAQTYCLEHLHLWVLHHYPQCQSHV